MGFTFDNEVYLFGALFKSKVLDGEYVFPDWHTQPDLTQVNELAGKVRPIPLTPVIVNALSGGEPALWGTTKEGKLVELGLGEPPQAAGKQPLSGEKVDSESSVPSDADNFEVLKLGNRPEGIRKGTNYELSFPPLRLLAQMIAPQNDPESTGGAKDLASLAENIKHFAQYIDDGTNNTNQTGVQFQLTEIAPSQLAPAYVGGDLTPEQQGYNDWLQRQKKRNKPLKGFVVPRMHSCAVLFTDNLYRGAEVSLVRPVKQLKAGDLESATEEVINVKVVDTNVARWAIEVGEKNVLPSALFNLDPSQVEDGFYLLRIQFWETEWKEFDETRKKLPESVLEANVTKQFMKHPQTGREQNVYTYELHEKLMFIETAGIGKMACVCGDMITLEEALIQQFPNQLPSYSDYATKGLTYQTKQKPGVAPLSLHAAINKTYESLSSDFLSIEGAKLYGPPAEMAKTIGQALWENSESGALPPFLMSGIALHSALAATSGVKKSVSLAKIFARKELTLQQVQALVFRKHVIDIPYIKRAFSAAGPESKIMRGVGRLSSDFLSGTNRALPAIGVIASGQEALDQYSVFSEQIKDAKEAQEILSKYAENYLSSLTFVRRFDEKGKWQEKAEKVQQALGKEGNAQIFADGQGVVVRMNFKFNSAEFENEVQVLHIDYKMVCDRLRQLLSDNSDYQVAIIGHAGPIGTHENNLKISKMRADVVKEAILAKASGEERANLESRLLIEFKGKSQLIDDIDGYADVNDRSDNADIAVNRRVEVRLIIPDFSVSLPPSRSGTMALNRAHQIWEGHQLAAKEAQDKLIIAAVDAMASVAIWTPAAPVAAYYFAGKLGADLLGAATDFYGDLFGDATFKEIKAQYNNKSMLKTLSSINKELISLYKGVSQDLQPQVIDAVGLADFLKKQANHDELLKRFLLRSYALNSLIELLTILRAKWSLTGDFDDFIEDYRVDEFIQLYVMNDNWEIPVNDGNTLALNWVNRFKKSGLFSKSDANSSLQWSYGEKIGGAFNTGFPVQTRLFLDRKSDEALQESASIREGLKAFCHDFNLAKEELGRDDIAFSRLLVQEDGIWKPYIKWVFAQNGRKLRPQTRVKLQVVLKDGFSSKTMFLQEVAYRAAVVGLDSHGPTFDVLFTKMGASQFEDPDKAIQTHFESKGVEELYGLEFEPTYGFGEFLIHGIKPLCPNVKVIDEVKAFFTGQSVFEYVRDTGAFEQMRYVFSLGGHDLLAGKLEGLGTYKNYTLDITEVNFGIDGQSSAQEAKNFNGRTLEKTKLTDTDFLIEEFVMSESASSRDSTPKVIDGNLLILPGIEIDGDLAWGEGDANKLISNNFDWSKEQRFSLCFAVLGDERASDDYDKMLLNAIECGVKLQIKDGPVKHDVMHYAGVVNIRSRPVIEQSNTGYNGIETRTVFDLELDDSDATKRTGLEQSAVQFIDQNDANFSRLLTSSEKKHLYIIRFEYSYVSPTGKLVNGLRPFGDVLDGNDLKPIRLELASFEQMDTSEGYELPKFELRVPAVKDFMTGKPWIETVEKEKATSEANHLHWKNLEAQNEQKRYVENWITKQASSLNAPEIALLQAK
ncbi:OmpA family protein [Vibrio vulnificus]|uniref:OmpA family protein n=1 Tax=Vibrio vulnificus TaxID=672 RepID=UPI001028B75E|nr:OmpA family protein [Vibrio vulnificus]ELB7529283.1 OmpA family protein [Vibrio vulnificus]ELK2275347.1 OmpA family protein [Vibrio vulnificus]MCA3967888.1 OmpA family protein [Vibrio vulnificus]MCU8514311.1 OmpA family protein [Vibrio vulnificus]NVC43463.1 OmpA family protein [Vibrio vulnificus]